MFGYGARRARAAARPNWTTPIRRQRKESRGRSTRWTVEMGPVELVGPCPVPAPMLTSKPTLSSPGCTMGGGSRRSTHSKRRKRCEYWAFVGPNTHWALVLRPNVEHAQFKTDINTLRCIM